MKGKEPIDLFMHLFPADLIDELHNTNLYAFQKGKENMAVTIEEIKTFLGINMVISLKKNKKKTLGSESVVESRDLRICIQV